eukprot:snap_masked-scaffold_45-processed-gene-1.34-mRNA-1 protein AED:1.00 eAED:1.00 QI:0/0/0/0/1/1/2/0/205
MNRTFSSYPLESIVGLLSAEIISLYSTHALLVSSNISIPSTFALAFALSRPLRRFRFPLDVFAAYSLSFAFPSLKKIKLTPLLNIRKSFSNKKTKEIKSKFALKIKSVIDKYGLSYLFGSRLMGSFLVFSIFFVINKNFSVDEIKLWLSEKFDEQVAESVMDKYGKTLASWAAAVSLSGIVYPFTIIIGTGFGRVFGNFGQKLKL